MSGALILRPGVYAGMLGLALAGAAEAAGPAADDLVSEGRRLYREGRGATGEAVSAVVQGDVPVLGTQMTCQSCHGRSGMGAIEGGRVPAALAGPLLFAASAQRRRPGYDDASLARALRDGIDPSGRSLDPLMPRFRLGDRDVAALAAYLRQLGVAPAPGVGPDSLRLATLVAGDVAPDVQAAVLDVLQAFVADRNQSGRQRLRGGHAPGQPKEAFREWTLDVWRLSGRPASWPLQLEARYRERPPFALVGGLASGPWQPIHDFCEAEQLPCLLPDADLPPADEGGFYSFYFSRGLRLEAGIVAAVLATSGLQANVLAVVEGDPRTLSGEAAAALARALEGRGGRLRILDARPESGASETLAHAIGESSAVVLWLGADAVRRLAADLSVGGDPPPIFLSSTLLEVPASDLPDPVRLRGRLVQLWAPPGEPDRSLERFRAWARARGVRLREERHQALAYFACLALAESTKHMGRFMARDYLVDLLDHASNLTVYLPLYLRAGFTPGQRVLSRGGYVIDLSGRLEPAWLVP